MADSDDTRGRRTAARGVRAPAVAGMSGGVSPSHGSGGGKTVKKSVTLREKMVEEIEARTGTRGFSQFVDEAAERHLALLKAREILDEHTARYGEFTDQELAEAEAAWHGG